MRISALLAMAVVIGANVPRHSEARVVRLAVEQTRRIADGKSFGAVGPYERIDGTVYMEVDPRDPLNAVILNLDKAPKNAKGLVEFSAPFFILRPVDMSRGNHKLFYGVNNRGFDVDITWRTFLPASRRGPFSTSQPHLNNNPIGADDFGDGLLLRLGYTYVDAGWQGNLAPGGNRLVPTLPVARGANRQPISGRVRVEFADADGYSRPLTGIRMFRSYEAADTDTSHSTLRSRSAVGGLSTPVAADQWAFGQCPSGKASLVATKADICLFEGFRRDRLYELIYPAQNPIVMGLGYAITRDLASFLRYEVRDDAGNRNPLAARADSVGLGRAYGSGISSTGMYMRDWLYMGFNEDEKHRKVFDAVHIIIPGTHRLLANVEFSDPNTYSRQDVWHDSLSYSYPPLTFAVTTDPISGIRDGILKRPATDPFVFQVDSPNEFWQMNASLNVHDGQGRPVPVPSNVRLYLASGFQHSGGTGVLSPVRPAGTCQYQTQGDSWAPTLRALLVALDEWADRGIEPPKSNYPTLEGKTLVLLAEAKAAFPVIPGVTFPTVVNELSLLNFGPHFQPSGGRITELPPAIGARYDVRVPKPDKDGFDIAGVRPIEVAAPIGTITGWNLRAAGHRAPDLCGLSGSFFPFAKTKADRIAQRDPRPSLEERYRDHDGFVKAVEAASRRLVKERFLLQEDAKRYIQGARGSNVLRVKDSTTATARQESLHESTRKR